MLLEGAAWLFKALPSNRKRTATTTARDEASSSSSSSSCGSEDAIPSTPKRSKRKWRDPRPSVQLYKDLLLSTNGKRTCCARMRCVECFATGKYDDGLLIAEQKRMADCNMEGDRKAFVLEHVPLRPLHHGAMIAACEPVCSNAFMWLFGVSSDLLRAVKGTPGARASSTVDRTPISAPRSRLKGDKIVAFMQSWVDTYGQNMPNNGNIFLYAANKEEIYGYYCDEQRRLHKDDPSSLREALVSPTYFNKVWAAHLPKVKIKVRGDFMLCETCTRLKGLLHGEPGQRPVQDKAARQRYQSEYDQHIKEITADREVIARMERRAQTAKADGRPAQFTYNSMDAAAQVKFSVPALSVMTHGTDRGWPERQKIYAVLTEGHSVSVSFVPQILGTGSNLVCTALYLQLMKLVEDYGETLEDVVFQVDNTVAENKNNYLLGCLGLLVARGVVKTATLMFMQVGHTHIKIDQIFSRFGTAVKGRNIFTRSHLAVALRNAYDTLPVHVTTLENLGNFKELLLGATSRVPRITAWRAFRVQMQGGACVVEVKRAMHHERWLGFSANGKEVGTGDGFSPHRLFFQGSVRIESLPSYKLKTVDPHTIHMIKQRFEASHSRMAAAFPGDPARVQALKQEQRRQLLLLERKGHLLPDLPVDWLPDIVPEGCDDSDEGLHVGGNDDGASDTDEIQSDHDSSEDEDEHGHCAAAGRVQGRLPVKGTDGNQGRHHATIGSFGFLLADEAPFLVGKIDRERTGEGGEREVCLHWFTPSARLVSQASSVEFEKYGRAVFSQTFISLPVEAGAGQRKKKKHVPDEGWEPESGIVTTCRLLRRSKYVPATVLKVLRAAKMASQG